MNDTNGRAHLTITHKGTRHELDIDLISYEVDSEPLAHGAERVKVTLDGIAEVNVRYEATLTMVADRDGYGHR